ncbi:unnamed protein product [Sphagnum compactum]
MCLFQSSVAGESEKVGLKEETAVTGCHRLRGGFDEEEEEEQEDGSDRQLRCKRSRRRSEELLLQRSRSAEAFGESLNSKLQLHSVEGLQQQQQQRQSQTDGGGEQRQQYGDDVVDSRGGKRKYEAAAAAASFSARQNSSLNRSPRVIYGSSMVAREKHMARRQDCGEGGASSSFSSDEDSRVHRRRHQVVDELQLDKGCLSLQGLSHRHTDDYSRSSSRTRPHKSSKRRDSFAGRRSGRRADSTARDDDSLPANADCRRGGSKGTDILSVSRGYRSRSSRTSPHPVHDEPEDLENLAAGSSSMELAFGREEEGDRRKQQGRDRWAERERHLQKGNQPKSEQKSESALDYTHKFAVTAPCTLQQKPMEIDPHRLCQRQKQIDYGKNTLGYERYLEILPRVLRKKQDPCTPDIRQVCSKRSWDGQIRKWRRLLHEYDPPKADDEEDPEMFDLARKQEVSSSPMDNSNSEVQSEADKFVEDVDLTIYNDWCDEES